MKHGMNKIKWGVALMFFGAAFNTSAELLASEPFKATAATNDYTAGLHVTATENQKIIEGNYGFSTGNPWANSAGAIKIFAGGLTHSGLVGSNEVGSLIIHPQKTGIDRNSYRNLAVGMQMPAASTYFLSGLVKLGNVDFLRGGQETSVGFEYTIQANEFSVSNGVHFGVRREEGPDLGGSAYLTVSAAGSSYDILDLTGHYGTTYQVVIRLDARAEGEDTVTAWYAADGDATLTVGLESTNVETWALGHDLMKFVAQEKSTYDFETTGARFDEIRLGTLFADVSTLPEPSISGAYEAWIANYPTAGVLTNRTDNPDNDALNNLYEWGLGGDPTNGADIGHLPTYGMVEFGGTNVLEYVYPKRNNADIVGLTYHLEQNTDLITGNWTNDNYLVGGTGTLDGEFNSVTNTVPTTTEDVQFLKLIIQDN